MPVIDILRGDDPRLRAKCASVDVQDLGKGGFPNRVRFRARVRDLVDTLANAGGLGLAAPQVGWMTRVIAVADSRVLLEERRTEKVPVVVMVNPVVLENEGEPVSRNEGCLSFPGAFAPISRIERCKVKWLSPHGEEHEHEFGGWDARCVLHEVEHLNGLLMTDLMDGDAKRDFLAKVAATAEK